MDEVSSWPPEKIEAAYNIEKQLYGLELNDLATPLSVENVGQFMSGIWKPYELACLVTGFKPNRRLVEWAQRHAEFDCTPAKINRAYEIASEGWATGILSIGLSKPEILKVFDDQGLAVNDILFKAAANPKELTRAQLLKKLDNANKTISKQKANLSSLTQIKQKRLLMMVAALAVGKWKYNPEAGKNDATAIMLKMLTNAGVKITSDTLLKHINHGLELLKTEAESDSEG